MKHHWKKDEKALYLPGKDPVEVEVPAMRFFALEGEGDPNGEGFGEAVGVLYSLSYALKMLPKKGPEPPGYFEYAVYPLEAEWVDIGTDPFGEGLDKNRLRYRVMIRQPDFANRALADTVMEMVGKKKPHALLEQAQFVEIAQGRCVPDAARWPL